MPPHRGFVIAGGCYLLLVVLALPSMAGHSALPPTEALRPGALPPRSESAAPPANPAVGAATGVRAPTTPLSLAKSPASPAALAGESTLALFNNSLLPGNVHTVAGYQPSYDVFDPRTNELFVTDFYTNIVDVVSTITNEVVAAVPAPVYPNSIAYDPVNGNVYVGLQTYDSVEVINGTTLAVLANDSVAVEPFYLAADPVSGNVFVLGENTSFDCNITVLSGTTGGILTSFALGPGRFPMTPTYDPRSGDFYVPSILAGAPGGTRGNLMIVNASQEAVVGNISLTFNPASALYVPSIDGFYVANASGNNITVLNGTTDLVTGQINGPNTPGLLAYAANGNVYVGTFRNNITVIDSSTGRITATFSDDRGPDGLAYDPANQWLYATDYVWNNVTAYSTATAALEATILLGVHPSATTYDPQDKDLYVYDYLADDLLVVNGSTDRVVRTLTNGTPAVGIVYDPVTNDIYETDYTAANLTIVNATTGAIAGWLGTGTYPWGIACDPTTGDLYVANADSDNVTVIDPVSGTTITSLVVGDEPLGVAFDPAEGTIDVADFLGSNVTVIDASNNHEIANVSVGPYDAVGPIALTADDPAGNVYVENAGTDNVTVIGGTNLTPFANVPIGRVGSPLTAAYDPLDGAVYFANGLSQNVSVLNVTNNSLEETIEVGVTPTSVSYDPADGVIAVANFAWGSLSLLPPSLPVVFTESGLPAGSPWSVNVSGTLWTTNGSTISFDLPNGTIAAYTVVPPAHYLSTPAHGNVHIDGGTVRVALEFGATYSVTFDEFGLPDGTAWTVTFAGLGNSSSTSVVGFLAADGPGYDFTVGSVPGYVAFPGIGDVPVSGQNVTVEILFDKTYAVTFVEEGIEAPFSWSVDFNGTANGSTTSSIGFAFANETSDTFSIVPVPGYTAHPSRGTVPIPGHAVTVSIQFVAVYTVTFVESGLPTGTVWGATFNNSANTSGTTSIVYQVPNGTQYTYQVSSTNAAYVTAEPTGSLVVDGASRQVNVSWTLRPVTEYQIEFVETGLPAGTTWQVTLLLSDPLVESSQGPGIFFNETNGSYAFSVEPITGYNTTPELGSVSVDGGALERPITFSLTPPPSNSGSMGSSGPSTAEIAVIIGAVAVIAVVGALALYWTRKGGGASPPRSPSSLDDTGPT